MNNWWDDFYNLQTADLFLRRDAKASERLTNFLEQQLEIEAGQTLFDQCCGIGTVSLPFAAKGVKVIGVDISEPFITEAKRLSEEVENAEFYQDDAFTFLPKGTCHAAINWYGSFGYADEDAQNKQMFERAYEALVSGGKFAVDFMNTYGILANFQAEMIKEKGTFKIVRNCTLDYTKGRIEQDWNYYKNGQYLETKHSSVKLYLPHHIQTMLEDCGFGDVQLFGDIAGNSLDRNSPRCILIGTKK